MNGRKEMQKCKLCQKPTSRIENHHLFGKNSTETIPICIICHDLIDRSYDNHILIEIGFRAVREFDDLPEEGFYYLRIMFLRMIKIFLDINAQKVKQTRGKQP